MSTGKEIEPTMQQAAFVTGRSWLHSGMGMTIVGAIEAVITYVSGAALRVV